MYSIQRETSDGTLVSIALAISYIDKADIEVYVNDVLASVGGYTWGWTNDTTLSITPAVPNGQVVMVKRTTPISAMYHNFNNGAVFQDSTMDENFRQVLYLTQEAKEGSGSSDMYADLNLHGYKVSNIGPAVADYDAVPFLQYKNDAEGAYLSRVSAEAARDTAVASASAAATSEANADASEAAASGYAASALSHRNTAETHKNAAAASASAAATSEANALSYRNTASSHKDAAAASAAEAAGYAAGLNLPSAVGQGGKALFQKADETGFEYRAIGSGSRNRIINGAFILSQRATPVNTGYGPDRWFLSGINNSVFGRSVDGSVSKVWLAHGYIQTGTVKGSLAASDYVAAAQRIEGYYVSDLLFGTAEAKTITLSFRMKASQNTVVTVALRNGTTNRSYVVPISVTTATQVYSITVPGDTSGTWEKDHTIGLEVTFCFAASTSGTFTTGTSGAWLTGNYIAHTTQANGLDTALRSISFSDVQLEIGTVATPFEVVPVTQLQQDCYRYYEAGVHCSGGWASAAGGQSITPLYWKANKRVNPVLAVDATTQNTNLQSITADNANLYGGRVVLTAASGGAMFAVGNFTANAEL